MHKKGSLVLSLTFGELKRALKALSAKTRDDPLVHFARHAHVVEVVLAN
jgi:hypothetical protein